MKRRAAFIAAVMGVAALSGVPAPAQIYPLAPPGNSVWLEPVNFIKSVYDSTGRIPDSTSPAIGHNLAQHPGAFRIGDPPPGTSFVGVFGMPIDTSNPNTKIYLWETSGHFWTPYNPFDPYGPPPTPNYEPGFGPQIEVGYWGDLYDPGWPEEPSLFTPYGTQVAYYQGTGQLVPVDSLGGFTDWSEVGSSVTPLRDFGIFPGFSHPLNAVRITAIRGSHNQVVAIAQGIPEPSTWCLFGIGLVGLLGWLRGRTYLGRSKFATG